MAGVNKWGANFGFRLKFLMKTVGMKRPELCRSANITQSSLCKYLQGKQIPKADVLPRLKRH